MRTSSLSGAAIALGDWRLYFLARDQVKRVTLADVQRVAAQRLRADNRTVATYLPTPKPERAPAPDGTRTYMDLVTLAHLADVDVDGLFIDFGTPARLKYTSGNWSSGFARDHETDGVTWTGLGTVGRVFFPADDASARSIHVRLKAVGGTRLIAFVNGTEVGGGPVEPGDYRDVRLEVPASVMRAPPPRASGYQCRSR